MTDHAPPVLHGLPPGVDFGAEVVRGLLDRFGADDPMSLARVEVFVNTRRMQRRLREVLVAGPARLLPKIRLITDLAFDAGELALPPPVPALRRRLELSQLVSRLLEQEPHLAPRAALFDLSDSLARLLDEMQGEGVRVEDINRLDVSDQSGHWQRAQAFIRIVGDYLAQGDAPDTEGRQRRMVEALVARWRDQPPDHPVVVAGSTGSRGATALFMQAVSRLPDGHVILPGFDFDLPADVWDEVGAGGDALSGQDHPQARFAALCQSLGIAPDSVRRWTDAAPPSPARTALLSLALRPAPVTDQWLRDGPSLVGLEEAVAGLTLVSADTPRDEAEAIALRLRAAVDEGQTAALITPDRTLTRLVTSALDRWNIVPDDSAGVPLGLTPPGRLLRQISRIAGRRLTSEDLLSILKHPLVGGERERNEHLLRTRDLELKVRRGGIAFPDVASLKEWCPEDSDRRNWLSGIFISLDLLSDPEVRPLSDWIDRLTRATEALCAGVGQSGSGRLWEEAAGRKAAETLSHFAAHADAGGTVTAREFGSLLEGVLGSEEARRPDTGHPGVLIWGTLEARVQSADLLILAGLNEGVWPETPTPDPWLNRKLRAEAGLLLPDRQIGLSAHDFQQGAAGREVWLTRSVRSDDAQTVPSRWLNRLTNLLGGLVDQNGPALLGEMSGRGDAWLARARRLSEPESPIAAATRPSPRPPVSARPKKLSVTQIKTLIRDPYAIYAREILRLKSLDPLRPEADAPRKGNLFHTIMERFVRDEIDPGSPGARRELLEIAADVLAKGCPWPAMQRRWFSQVARIADEFLDDEIERRRMGTPSLIETRGGMDLAGLDFRLTGQPDRIDVNGEGEALIYDYKTGTPPSAKQQVHFDKQLLLEAVMVARGAFQDLPATAVRRAAFIGLGSKSGEFDAKLDENPPGAVWEDFHLLMSRWAQPGRGYTARLAHFRETDQGRYDHLSRFGEWGMSDPIVPEDLE